KAAVEALAPRAEAAKTRHEEARMAHAEAERLHGEIRTAHSAQAIRASLIEGEACPVCDQIVASLPGRGPGHAALKAAERNLNEAKRGLEAAAREEQESAVSAARAHSVIEQAEARLAALPHNTSAPEPEELERAQAAAAAARTAHETATNACRTAGQEVTQRTARQASAATAFNGLKTQHHTLSKRAEEARLALADSFGDTPVDVARARIEAAQDRLRTLRTDEAARRKAAGTSQTELETATHARRDHEA